MHKIFLLISTSILSLSLTAQSSGIFWKKIEKEQIQYAQNAKKKLSPNAFLALELDFPQLIAYLQDTPQEFAPTERSKTKTLQLPNTKGQMESFEIQESSLMTESFQQKHPEMRQFIGYSLDTPGKSVRFNYSPIGFYATFILPSKVIEYIEPVAQGETQYYMCYSTKDLPKSASSKGYVCGYDNQMNEIQSVLAKSKKDYSSSQKRTQVDLRTYRFIVSTTAEFSIDHGGNKPDVLAAILNYVSSMNAILEPELALRLVLIEETENVIFLDPNTHPWVGTEVGNWMNANPTIISQAAPNADYDLGHNFARYFTGTAIGVAGGRACNNSNGGHKAKGSSAGRQNIYGNSFIETIVHEVGHQCSAGHSWNNCPSAQQQYAPGSACEPGSGSTIMSYQGACGAADNISGPGGTYYTACNILEQLHPFIHSGAGATCGDLSVSTNSHPEVTVDYPESFAIPKSTPFELTASAVDPDGDPIYYCWEGTDIGPQSTLGSPSGSAPLFRSFDPRPEPNRVFPRMSVILNNMESREEVLPDYARQVSLIVTARDNKMGGGGLGYAEVKFNVAALAGPFLVEYPNEPNDVLIAGSCSEIRWDVANTDKAPVNCSAVDILLSTDGGQTFPISLATNAPNVGVAYVEIPSNLNTAQARLRINAADNIFFDLSNHNFTIEDATAPGFSFCLDNVSESICLPGTFTTQVQGFGYGGYNETLSLNVTGLPTGANASFSTNTIQANESSNLQIDLPEGTSPGNFEVSITAEDQNGNLITRMVNLEVISNNFDALMPSAPTDGASGVEQAPDLAFNMVPDAQSYEIQLATSPAFNPGDIVASDASLTSSPYLVPVLLEKGKAYFWRVRGKNQCTVTEWRGPFVFNTVVESCATSQANDLPIVIPSSTVTLQSQVNVFSSGIISDLNVKSIQGSHAEFADLTLRLIGPDGTAATLVDRVCTVGSTGFKFGFDDAAPSDFTCPPSQSGEYFIPDEDLARFNGKDALGSWTLEVVDNIFQAGGTITAFELEICGTASLNSPVLVTNQPITIDPGVNELISTDFLAATDADTPNDKITFTMVEKPQYGDLRKNGVNITEGMTWTQADIEAGRIRFYDWGNTTVASDGFRFIITDGDGGFVGTPYFTVLHSTVGTTNLFAQNEMTLVPNPTVNRVQIQLRNPLSERTAVTIYDVTGSLVLATQMQNGEQQKEMDLSRVPSGLYFVQLENKYGRITSKLVKN